jgi:hypothetical protein
LLQPFKQQGIFAQKRHVFHLLAKQKPSQAQSLSRWPSRNGNLTNCPFGYLSGAVSKEHTPYFPHVARLPEHPHKFRDGSLRSHIPGGYRSGVHHSHARFIRGKIDFAAQALAAGDNRNTSPHGTPRSLRDIPAGGRNVSSPKRLDDYAFATHASQDVEYSRICAGREFKQKNVRA